MVDINRDEECPCRQCRTQQEVTDFIAGRLRGDASAFNKEFMPLLELLTSATAPLMTLLEARNSHPTHPENNREAIDMAGLVLVMLHQRIDQLIEHAGYFAIDEEANLLHQDGADQCSDWDK